MELKVHSSSEYEMVEYKKGENGFEPHGKPIVGGYAEVEIKSRCYFMKNRYMLFRTLEVRKQLEQIQGIDGFLEEYGGVYIKHDSEARQSLARGLLTLTEESLHELAGKYVTFDNTEKNNGILKLLLKTISLNSIPQDISEAITTRQQELRLAKNESKQRTRQTIANAHQKELGEAISSANKKAKKSSKKVKNNKRKHVESDSDDSSSETDSKKKKVSKKKVSKKESKKKHSK
ncbi:predicted protein [Naegleria gruberi]|uniref:Predicted protein n=1 Tax=Naegleria gruberi TaxID=5762 RepID=D2W6F6_NAEGR|nr:uncharacterized protein NAEGRDRAFT_77000 [Naegleria gruberi]EFC35346.1 predicted protein [Naegleria gruberi]|eukprot:XP_002668090.1 predicted protein [Naegleria gruberi strain NEG-M]